jgi:hypothetical protein
MRELIERIRQQAILLEFNEDSIVLDKDLGEIESLIHTARQEIDDEWRSARDRSRPHYKAYSIGPEEQDTIMLEIVRDIEKELR